MNTNNINYDQMIPCDEGYNDHQHSYQGEIHHIPRADLDIKVMSHEQQRRFPPDSLPLMFRNFDTIKDRDAMIAKITDNDPDAYIRFIYEVYDSNDFIAIIPLQSRLTGESDTKKSLCLEHLRLQFILISHLSTGSPDNQPGRAYIDNGDYSQYRDYPAYNSKPIYANMNAGAYPPGEIEYFVSRAFIPNDYNEPAYRPPAIEWFGQELAPVGSLVAIVASPGVGKSSTVEMSAEAVVTGSIRLGLRFSSESRIAIIDGEMTDQEVYRSYKRIKRRIGETPPYPILFGTLGYTIPERRKLSEYLINELGYNMLIFDGGTDLIHDTNDLREADEVLNQWLRPMLNKTESTAILTIHDNPDKTGMRSEKPRGHFGAEVLRRSTGILNITFDRKTGVRTLSTAGSYGKFRHGNPNQSAYFAWDDQHKMMTELDSPPIINDDKRLPMPDLLEIEYKIHRIFKGFDQGMLRSELIDRIVSTFSHDYNISQRKAQEILTLMRSESIVKTHGKEGTRSLKYFIFTQKIDDL